MLTMRKVGEILRQARLEKNLTIQQVYQSTKIKESYLEAIEESRYDALPISTFTKGLIQNYAKFLGLNAQEILAVFRREFNETKERIDHAPKLVQQRFFRITPSIAVRFFTALIIIGLLGYFIREYRILTGPPKLVIKSPAQNSVITDSSVTVAGSTTTESAITVNDDPVTVDANGNFSTIIDFPGTTGEGNQMIHLVIKAKNKSGKQNIIDRTIILK